MFFLVIIVGRWGKGVGEGAEGREIFRECPFFQLSMLTILI